MCEYENTAYLSFKYFGAVERKKALEILKQIVENGLPIDFEDDEVEILQLKETGKVLLHNANFQTACIDPRDGKLKMYHSLSYIRGEDGFLYDIMARNSPIELHPKDVAYVRAQQPEYTELLKQFPDWKETNEEILLRENNYTDYLIED